METETKKRSLRDVLKGPECWVKLHNTADKDGKYVPSGDPECVRMCLREAFNRAYPYGSSDRNAAEDRLLAAIQRRMPIFFKPSMMFFNDREHTTWEAIVEVIEEAQA